MKNGKNCQNINCFYEKLLTIHFRKVLIPFLWEMEKVVKTLIFFSFPIKIFFK